MRYNNLHAGRLVAAVTVLAFHLVCHAHWMVGLGDALMRPIPAALFTLSGVYLFVLSGFVLTHVLQTGTLREYLGLRLLRLFPAYWAVAASVLVVRHLVGGQIPFDNRGLWYAFTLYPAGPNRSAFSLGVEWTLVYEMLLSLAIIPLAACGRRWGLGVGATVWLALVVGKMIAVDGRDFKPFPKLSEFPLSVINAPFLLGMLVYLGKAQLARVRLLLPLVAVVAVTAGCLTVTTAAGSSYLLQAIGVAATVGFLAGGRQVSAGNPLVRAGDWTYGIYLIHVPVMLACFGLCVRYGLHPDPLAAVLVAGALSFLAGCLLGAAEWAAYRRLRSWFKSRPHVSAVRPTPVSGPVLSRAA